MKTFFTTLLLLFAFTAFAQDKPTQELPVDANGKINYTEVVQVDGADKDELYTRARAWFATSYRSANNVLEMDDKSAGVLIGGAFQDITIMSMGYPVTVKLWYNLKVYLKDGRYKYEITDLFYENYPNQYYPTATKTPAEEVIITNLYKKNGKPSPINHSYKEKTIVGITALYTNLKDAMQKSASASAGDDW